MYDLNRPYSIDDWNRLIQAVNAKLANPPADTACEPLPPLPEVSDPHIWSTVDIEEVRGRLKATCPKINFSTELGLWRPEIIDEIVSAMSKAWCDCEPETPREPVTDTLLVGVFGWSLIQAAASQSQCCGTIIESAPCYICVGQHCHETWFRGEFFNNPYNDNQVVLEDIRQTYPIAYQALSNYILSMTEMMDNYRQLAGFQATVDSAASSVDRCISLYKQATNDSDRAYWAQRICQYGTSASNYQELVDATLIKVGEKSAAAAAYKDQANQAAIDNMANVLRLEGRFPGDENTMAAYLDVFRPTAWDGCFDPSRDKYLCKHDHWLLHYRTADDALPRYNIYYLKNGSTTRLLPNNIYAAPNGIPLIGSGTANGYLREYVLTYYERRDRWRKEVGSCEFPDWSSVPWEEIHWSQSWKSGGLSGRVWSPLPPQDPDSKGTESFYLEVHYPVGKQRLNPEAQQQFDASIASWHNTHPRYDNRHEAYC